MNFQSKVKTICYKDIILIYSWEKGILDVNWKCNNFQTKRNEERWKLHYKTRVTRMEPHHENWKLNSHLGFPDKSSSTLNTFT